MIVSSRKGGFGAPPSDALRAQATDCQAEVGGGQTCYDADGNVVFVTDAAGNVVFGNNVTNSPAAAHAALPMGPPVSAANMGPPAPAGSTSANGITTVPGAAAAKPTSHWLAWTLGLGLAGLFGIGLWQNRSTR